MDDDLVLAALIALAGSCCVGVGALAWRSAAPRGVEQRIRSAARTPVMAARSVAERRLPRLHFPAGVARLLQALRGRWRGWLWLHRLITAAGATSSVQAFLIWSAGCGTGVLLLADWLDGPLALTLVLAAGAALLPLLRLLRQRARRWEAIEAQLPDALDTMARAMQAGQAFSRALRMAGTEGPLPIAREWRITADEINFGLSEEAALANLAARVRLPDMRYFVAAVLIQREAGGNITQLLSNLSALVRERVALRGAVQVMSAEGRISAWILGTMPFVIALLVSVMNPKFLSVLWTDPLGVALLWAALGSMTLGALWMRSVIRITF